MRGTQDFRTESGLALHNRTDVCLRIDTVTVPASVTSRGDLCLIGTGKITGSRSKVEVGDDVTLASPNASIGASGSSVSRAEVVDLGGWPTFYEWAELQSLIAGQMYGSFAMAASYTLILGEQVG